MPLAEGVSFDLTVIWAFLIAFAVLVYVILDGFDLGLGMLFAIERQREDRDVMMNSVAPVWDGNETWLILGGGGLFAAFPLAYALILPALYAPIIAMLLALIFRGVAFEFRWRAGRWRGVWDCAFIGGSAVAAWPRGSPSAPCCRGSRSTRRHAPMRAAGGTGSRPSRWSWAWPSWSDYMLLGATWLVMKTTGDLQERMRRRAWSLGVATVGFIGLVSLWTPFLQEGYYSRWFVGWQRGLAVLVATGGAGARRADVPRAARSPPRLLALRPGAGMFTLCFVGLGISMFPYIVPTEVTLWEAAAPRNAQVFMLVGAGILIPIILAYTAYAYWIFRGKIDAETGYH